LLLDDVMSELDASRRGRLAETLARYGQSVVSTTELEHVPSWDGADVAHVAVDLLDRDHSAQVTP
jgi:DNA replication and repair protein RecF